MARISITCGCGWNFFISEATLGWQIACPSCGTMVPIPGRKPGQAPESHAEIARARDQKKKAVILSGAAVAVLAIVGTVFLLMGGEAPKPGREARKAGDRGSSPSSPAGAAPVKVNIVETKAPPPKPPLPADGQPAPAAVTISSLRQEADRLVTFMNMTGIVAELLRLQGRAEAFERLKNRQSDYESRLKNAVERLFDRGEKYPVPAHISPGDRMIFFAEKDLVKLGQKEAVEHVDRWLRAFMPGCMTQCDVVRGPDTLHITLFFPEQNSEILSIMKEAAIVPGEPPVPGASVSAAAPPPPAPLPEVVPLPEDLAQSIRQKFSALPAGYRQFIPVDDRERMDRLLKTTTKVFKDDVEFLRGRILGEVLATFEAEHLQFQEKARELEDKTRDLGGTDVVHFKDGRKIEGKVEEETEEFVKIKSRFGSVKVPRGDIQKIDRGKGAASEFPERFKKAQGKADELTLLMAWCKEKNLPVHKEFVCNLILALDPLNDRARAEINVPRPLAKLLQPTPQDTNESVSRKIESIAAETTARTAVLDEVASEMRRQTERMKYTAAVPPPDRFSQAATLIQDPIQFRTSTLKPDAAVILNRWWDGLSPEERRQFAHFFGLWCAYVRTVTNPAK